MKVYVVLHHLIDQKVYEILGTAITFQGAKNIAKCHSYERLGQSWEEVEHDCWQRGNSRETLTIERVGVSW